MNCCSGLCSEPHWLSVISLIHPRQDFHSFVLRFVYFYFMSMGVCLHIHMRHVCAVPSESREGVRRTRVTDECECPSPSASTHVFQPGSALSVADEDGEEEGS